MTSDAQASTGTQGAMPAADDGWRPQDHAARSEFWEGVHDAKEVDGVSWWQSVPGLSASALATVRGRLPDAGSRLTLTVADVLDLDVGRTFELWHDRAVFHFLTEPDEREDYRASLHRSLAPHGWLVVATFGPDGPTTCSGLPICRYTHDELVAQFPGFDLVATAGEDHVTPWGSTQQFTAVLMRRRD